MSLTLQMPDVTLCCVDTRHTGQAWQAIQRCMANAQFGQVLFFCSQEAAATAHERPGIQHIAISTLRSIQDYSRFMLRELGHHVQTSHALVIQWDGYITSPECWRDDFLSWDYIGAPWVYKIRPSEVGNGGFSLRSRALLQATQVLPWDGTQPEDDAICRAMRPSLETQHGLKIAPVPVAERFSHEYGPHTESFGFHGMHNFAHRMGQDELARWLQNAPADLLTHWHARNLVKNLIKVGRNSEARRLIRKRIECRGLQLDDVALWIRSALR
jgi:Protein of unknown function (DUF5672)